MRRLDIRNKELWIDIEQAFEIKESKLADGIGLILLDSDVFVLDLDNCYNFNTKQLSNFAQEIVEHFNDTYIEISPSNQGLHVIGLEQLELIKRVEVLLINIPVEFFFYVPCHGPSSCCNVVTHNRISDVKIRTY